MKPRAWQILVTELLDMRVRQANARDGKKVAPPWNRKDMYNLYVNSPKFAKLYRQLNNFWEKQ